jgi:hypothetical protein
MTMNSWSDRRAVIIIGGLMTCASCFSTSTHAAGSDAALLQLSVAEDNAPAQARFIDLTVGSSSTCSVSDGVLYLDADYGGCSTDTQITWDFTDQLVI